MTGRMLGTAATATATAAAAAAAANAAAAAAVAAADRDRDRGSVGLELALGLGLLVLPVAMLVAVFPGWAERTAMARVAAQEAARFAVLADDPAAGEAGGTAMAFQVAANHGIPGDDLTAAVAVPRDALGAFQRGGEATATVAVAIRLPATPLSSGAKAFRWTVTHTERIDDYRSVP